MAASAAVAPRPASALAIGMALAAVYLIWGSTYLGIRFALEGGWPAMLGVSGGRMLVAGALLFAVLRLRGVPSPTRAQWPTLAVMGLLMMLLGNGMVVLAEKEVSSGLVLLLIAPIAWAFGSVWSRGRDLPSPFMAAAAQMLCGGVMLIALGLSSGEHWPAAPTAHGTAALVYLALFGSIAGFGAYIWLLHHVRPALAGSYAYVNPPIAVLLGAWLGGEHFSLHDLGAMGVILVGVVAISRAKARATAGPSR